jgi:hypothetical protein
VTITAENSETEASVFAVPCSCEPLEARISAIHSNSPADNSRLKQQSRTDRSAIDGNRDEMLVNGLEAL